MWYNECMNTFKYGRRDLYDAALNQIITGLWKVDPEAGLILSARKGWKPIGSLRDGYMRVAVPFEDGFSNISSHRVIWESVNGPSDLDLTVNHVNGNMVDNRISNLELATNQENTEHGHKVLKRGNGSRNKGSVNPRARLTEEKVKVIKQRLRNGDNYRTIAMDYEVSPLTIHSIKRGANWGHIQ